jgi:hypothetical protein
MQESFAIEKKKQTLSRVAGLIIRVLMAAYLGNLSTPKHYQMSITHMGKSQKSQDKINLIINQVDALTEQQLLVVLKQEKFDTENFKLEQDNVLERAFTQEEYARTYSLFQYNPFEGIGYLRKAQIMKGLTLSNVKNELTERKTDRNGENTNMFDNLTAQQAKYLEKQLNPLFKDITTNGRAFVVSIFNQTQKPIKKQVIRGCLWTIIDSFIATIIQKKLLEKTSYSGKTFPLCSTSEIIIQSLLDKYLIQYKKECLAKVITTYHRTPEKFSAEASELLKNITEQTIKSMKNKEITTIYTKLEAIAQREVKATL